MKKLNILIVGLVLFFVTPLVAQTQPVPQVTATGSATLRVDPNVAHITFYVQQYDKEYRSASNKVSKTVKKYAKGLNDIGVAHLALGSEALTPSTPGYTVTRSIVARVSDFEKLPALIAYLADRDIRLYVTFTHTDIEQMTRDVEKEAMKNARNKAFQLAEIAGSSIGTAFTISAQNPSIILPQNLHFDGRTPDDVAFQVGLVTVTQYVSASFTLERKTERLSSNR